MPLVARAGVATLRAQNGKLVASLKGKREVLVKHYRKLGTSTANDTLGAEFEKEINAVQRRTRVRQERKAGV